MKALYDLLPLGVFFAAYSLGDIYWATALAIVTAAGQLLYGYLVARQLERTHVINFVVIFVFGGLTLALRDDTFIKWKPTIVNWLFAAVFAGSLVIGKRSLLERMLGQHLVLSGNIWRRMTVIWTAFFMLCGALNLYVAFGLDLGQDDLSRKQRTLLETVTANEIRYAEIVLKLDPDDVSATDLKTLVPQTRNDRINGYLESVALDYWVKFKVFGLFGLTLVFVLLQSVYLSWLTSRNAAEKLTEAQT